MQRAWMKTTKFFRVILSATSEMSLHEGGLFKSTRVNSFGLILLASMASTFRNYENITSYYDEGVDTDDLHVHQTIPGPA